MGLMQLYEGVCEGRRCGSLPSQWAVGSDSLLRAGRLLPPCDAGFPPASCRFSPEGPGSIPEPSPTSGPLSYRFSVRVACDAVRAGGLRAACDVGAGFRRALRIGYFSFRFLFP